MQVLWRSAFHLALLGSIPGQASQPASTPARPPEPELVALEFRSALARGDVATQRAITAGERTDAWLVASALWIASLDDPRAEIDLQTFVDGAMSHPAGKHLATALMRWRALDAQGLELGRRLAVLAGKARAARFGLDAVAASALVPETEDLAARAPWSADGVEALSRIARTLQLAGEREHGLMMFQRVQRLAKELGWQQRAAEISRSIAAQHFETGDFAAAAAVSAEELSLREALGDAAMVAGTLGNLALAHQGARSWRQAEHAYTREIEIRERLGDRSKLGISLQERGLVRKELDELDSGAADLVRATALLEDVGNAEGVVAALVNLANVRECQGRYEEQLKLLEDACTRQDRCADAKRRAIVQANLASAYQRIGLYSRCEAGYQRALELAAMENDRLVRGQVEMHLAILRRKQGRFAEALRLGEAASETFRKLRDPNRLAQALHNQGLTHAELGQYALAESCFSDSLQRHQNLGGKRSAALVGIDWALLLHRTRRNHDARLLVEPASAELARIGDRASHGNALGVLALIQESDRQYDEAIATHTRALAEARASSDPFPEAAMLGNIGTCYEHLERYPEALEWHEKALTIKLALGIGDGAAVTLQNMARCSILLGRPQEALDLARRSLAQRLLVARGLDYEGHELRSRARDASDLGICALEELAREEPKSHAQRIADALWFAESGRAVGLLESLATRAEVTASPAAPELLSRLAETRYEAAVSQRALVAASTRGALEAKAARARLDTAHLALAEASARVHRATYAHASFVTAEPVDLATLQAALPADTAFVHIQQLYTGSGIALVITKLHSCIVRLGEAEDLGERVQRFLLLAATPGSDDKLHARRLYQQLWKPIATRLDGATRVLLSPEAALATLPFEALLDDAGRRAIERWEFVYVPSATVWRHLAKGDGSGGGRGLLALGDPVYPGEKSEPLGVAGSELAVRGLEDLRRLPGSGEEVRGLAELFPAEECNLLLREAATLAGLQPWLSRPSARLAVAHFACHGHVDAERPLLTGLVLAHGEVLSLQEVTSSRLLADLVVLSACETARGKAVASEGTLGLARAFLVAGATDVIASAWKVPDRGSKDLMLDFYRRMRIGGASPAAALREAKLAMLARGGESAHPSAWAPFLFWGVGRR